MQKSVILRYKTSQIRLITNKNGDCIMSEIKVTRRDQIKELIETGEFTKKEIAEKLEIKESGVSSQLTYLRWMGFFIIWDEDKKLSFVDEDGYAAWEAEKKTNRKTPASTSKKTPQEQFDGLTKTIGNQEKTLAKWEDKLSLLNDEDQTDGTLIPEAEANITLLQIKIQRNQAKLEDVDMDEVAETEDEAPEAPEEVEDADEELL